MADSHNAALSTAVQTFLLTDMSVEHVTTLQNSYRPIPVAARAGAQQYVFPLLMAAGTDAASAVFAAFNSLPSSTTARVIEHLTEDELDSIRSTFKYNVGRLLDPKSTAYIFAVGTDADDSSNEPIDQRVTDAYEALMTRTLAYIAKAPMGTGKTDEDGLVEMLADGRLTVGTTLAHGDKTATVLADGLVSYDNQPMSISKAGRLASGSKSTNGYVFWQIDGKAVKTYRLPFSPPTSTTYRPRSKMSGAGTAPSGLRPFVNVFTTAAVRPVDVTESTGMTNHSQPPRS
jgi:hypothetical protein